MAKYSEKQNKATQAYFAKKELEQIAIRVQKGGRDALNEAARERGESTAQFIVNAVNARAGREVMRTKVKEKPPNESDKETEA